MESEDRKFFIIVVSQIKPGDEPFAAIHETDGPPTVAIGDGAVTVTDGYDFSVVIPTFFVYGVYVHKGTAQEADDFARGITGRVYSY